MTTAKMAGWKKILLLGVAAFVSVGVLLTVVGVGTLLWANSVVEELGEPTPVPTALTIAVAREAAAPCFLKISRTREQAGTFIPMP